MGSNKLCTTMRTIKVTLPFLVALQVLLVSWPQNPSGNLKVDSVSKPNDLRALDNKTLDSECSPLLPSRLEGIKIISCANCIENESEGEITAGKKVCFLTKTCRDQNIVDGILWNGNTAGSFPEARRNATNKHQVWIARATETHVLPHVNRSIGNAEWMASMNYARHFGLNTDFPAFGVPQKRSWPKLEQSLLDQKTAGIVYMSSNCAVQSDRDDFVRRASYFMDIASVGSCAHNTDVPVRIKHLEEDADGNNLRHQWKNYGPAAHKIISAYRFRLLLDSTICADYWAEKVEQTLSAGAIPIYLGIPNSHDWDPGIAAGVHPAMIHVQDFNSLSELADFVHDLGADTETARLRRLRYFEHQGREPVMFPRHGEHLLNLTGGDGWLEFVCRRMHDGDPARQAGEQLPCSGTWWRYLENIGKNLTLWGCTDTWPCVSSKLGAL